jgi:hypothetical protein
LQRNAEAFETKKEATEKGLFAGLGAFFTFEKALFSNDSHTADNLHLLEDPSFLKIVQWVDDTDAQLVRFESHVTSLTTHLRLGQLNALMATVRGGAEGLLASDRVVTAALAEFSGRSQVHILVHVLVLGVLVHIQPG